MKRLQRLVLPAAFLVPWLGCAHASHPVASFGPSVKPPLYDQVIVASGPDPVLPVSPETSRGTGSGRTDDVSDSQVASEPPITPSISDNTDLNYVGDEEEPATAVWVESEAAGIADPIEPLNRALFVFNDKAYFWVMKPVARGYRAVVPEVVRLSVRNFFSNIAMPIRFVNNLLQGKIRNSGVVLLRFAINTTAGIGGLFDPAKNDFHLSPRDEDLGQTFGKYGLGHGLYIVLPLLGPSSLRDGIGLAGDSFLDPVYYVGNTEVIVGAKVFKAENEVSLRIGEYEDLTKSAIDPYVAVRDAYVQYRWNKVRDGGSKAVIKPGFEE